MAEKRQHSSEVYNIAHELLSRESGTRLNSDSQIKFRNFQLLEEFDTNQPSRILNIISGGRIIFALAQSSVCAAFDRNTNKRICYLNLNPHELIRKLYYNKENNSLITGSVNASDRFSKKYRYRTTQLEYIRRAQPDAGFDLFLGEELIWVDIPHGKALTFSAQDHIYKVFDLKNYTLLYSISDKEIDKIKTSPGILLLISRISACGSSIHLKILSIEDGKVLKSIHHALLPNKKVVYLELRHAMILIVQENNEYVQMIDTRSEKIIELSREEPGKDSAVLFLQRFFLGFESETVFVWNLQGELVTFYRNNMLQIKSGVNARFIHVTRGDELLISYNKVGSSLETDKGNCPIHITNILTGKCCGKIGGDDPDVDTSSRNRSVTRIKIQEALQTLPHCSMMRRKMKYIQAIKKGLYMYGQTDC